MAPGQGRGHRSVPVGGLWRALGLTLASTFVWGAAHVAAGRRGAGFTLMGVLVLLVGGAATLGLVFQDRLKQLVVQGTWLNVFIAVLLALALVWASVVIRSYQVVRPAGLPAAMRVASTTLVVVLSLLICTPFVYAANATYVLRDTLSKIFPGDDHSGPKVNAADPWKNMPRVNVLLLGGDGGRDRKGIRTDSMTVASIDTKTGNTVMLSIPRGLYGMDMPPRMQSRFPNGYQGEPGPGVVGRDRGLLNELYLYGEHHPELEPRYKKGQRGPHLLEEVIGNLLGLKIDYYVMVNLAGFKDIVNAMGGVDVRVEKPANPKLPGLPIGGEITPDGRVLKPPTGYLYPGKHHLNGEQALWYGRTRHADDDFHRMDRQKCLLKDIAEQANPQKVVTHFEKLAQAATNTISTNIPSALLPALVKLSGTVKHGADITSLTFSPYKIAGFHTDRRADATIIQVMRRVTNKAIAASVNPSKAEPSPTTTAKKRRKTKSTASNGSVSLKNACG
ncbi:LCP family protein [Actinoallomurus spadix]|uniref:Cell envelope-related transcriptional attenuator domain-containing protein n=1 Tax=Actinoallomurus spadix TaxID=79912 RepID=A0ABN0X584_9ACTN|nr:LCP family protein [Actinoallomurus spadix]MCO5986835.1 LCP family protein [Actinoallomurus spadix]